MPFSTLAGFCGPPNSINDGCRWMVHWEQASLHCGLIRGGEEPSSYPAKCTVTVETRTIPCQTKGSILRDLKTLLRDIVRIRLNVRPLRFVRSKLHTGFEL